MDEVLLTMVVASAQVRSPVFGSAIATSRHSSTPQENN
jgi:hypothetical protein